MYSRARTGKDPCLWPEPGNRQQVEGSGRRWSSNPSGKCSYERPTRGTVCGTMRSMCGADAGCLAINYQSLERSEAALIFRNTVELIPTLGALFPEAGPFRTRSSQAAPLTSVY